MLCHTPPDNKEVVGEAFFRLHFSLTLTGPCPYGGLEPPQHLLEGQYSRKQATQEVSGVHW